MRYFHVSLSDPTIRTTSPLPAWERDRVRGRIMSRHPLLSNARALRKSSTEAERRLWAALRARRADFKFRRQVPLQNYIVDFVCFDARLIVELDGSQHGTDAGKAKDAIRDGILTKDGFLVLRFANWQVFQELDVVVNHICERCKQRVAPSPYPSPTRGEGTTDAPASQETSEATSWQRIGKMPDARTSLNEPMSSWGTEDQA